MPDNELTVKIDAQTENAVEAIDEVTEAIERLNEAIDELGETPVRMEINTVGSTSLTRVDTSGSGDWIEWSTSTDHDLAPSEN